uniref:LEM domain-containing protein n=2 Tax=Steinernema glaseri TaxID=37863 RepID=A0A1I8AHR5_9BILA
MLEVVKESDPGSLLFYVCLWILSVVRVLCPNALLTLEKEEMIVEPEALRKLQEERRNRKSNLSLLHLLAGSDSQDAVESARYLLETKQYDVNCREEEGITALHVAANWSNLAMCHVLLAYGADPDLEDEEGRTALGLAEGRTREFLLKYRKMPKKKRRSLVRRFWDVLKPTKGAVVRKFGPRRLCRSLGGCLIALADSNKPRRIHSPAPPESEMKTEEEPKAEEAEQPAPSSQEETFHDALEDAFVTTRRKRKPADLPEGPVPEVPSTSKMYPELPLETTLEYLTCDEDEEEAVVIPDWIKSLSDRHLRMRLVTLKQKVGPITTETRLLYQRRLALMMKDSSTANTVTYSAPLQRLLEGKPPNVGRTLDKIVRGAFRSDIASPHQRQGNNAAFFCYLLIDPKLVQFPADCSLQEFVGAIFYVGKGKKSRPVQHLVDAARSRSSNNPRSDKLRRILDLWDGGRGVVSLQVFQNVISVESHCREAAMLDAIGIRHLTNLKRGEYYDVCVHWNSRQREEFGAFLIHSAWQIFRIEGSREIFEKDVF